MSETSVLEKLFEKMDTKLDNIQKEINEFKSGIQTNLINLTNKVEIHETKLTNIDKHFNKSLKDRIVDMIMSGVVYSVAACIGISLFFLILKGVGGNIITILKPILAAFTGV